MRIANKTVANWMKNSPVQTFRVSWHKLYNCYFVRFVRIHLTTCERIKLAFQFSLFLSFLHLFTVWVSAQNQSKCSSTFRRFQLAHTCKRFGLVGSVVDWINKVN